MDNQIVCSSCQGSNDLSIKSTMVKTGETTLKVSCGCGYIFSIVIANDNGRIFISA